VPPFSEQRSPGGDERGNERHEKSLGRNSAIGLAGHECAVDGGQREPRQLVGSRAPRIVAERGCDLSPQQLERVVAYPADDGLFSPSPVAGGCAAKKRSAPRAMEVLDDVGVAGAIAERSVRLTMRGLLAGPCARLRGVRR
jgi:hypothetical protein